MMMLNTGRGGFLRMGVGVVLPMLLSMAVLAGSPDDIDFITIGDAGNIGYQGGPSGTNAGRGSVDYEYRISRTEITTGQYVNYLNMFSTQSDELWGLLLPGSSGLRLNGIGRPWTLSQDLLDPESAGIEMSWRQAAMFCNWMHNGQTSDPASLLNGAYDTSTFTMNDDFTFNDQDARNPDAKYWIPNLDEYLKAGYYDPDKNGNGPGWWEYGHSSDEDPVHGMPGIGDVGRELTDEQLIELTGSTNPRYIPLGLYDNVQSPWGLLDILGGYSEHVEDWVEVDRRTRWSRRGSNTQFVLEEYDQVWSFWPEPPFDKLGFRIASSVPGPGPVGLVYLSLTMCFSRKRVVL